MFKNLFRKRCDHDWKVLSKTTGHTIKFHEDTYSWAQYHWTEVQTDTICSCNKCGEIKKFTQVGK